MQRKISKTAREAFASTYVHIEATQMTGQTIPYVKLNRCIGRVLLSNCIGRSWFEAGVNSDPHPQHMTQDRIV
jgi:hypothetical protein